MWHRVGVKSNDEAAPSEAPDQPDVHPGRRGDERPRDNAAVVRWNVAGLPVIVSGAACGPDGCDDPEPIDDVPETDRQS